MAATKRAPATATSTRKGRQALAKKAGTTSARPSKVTVGKNHVSQTDKVAKANGTKAVPKGRGPQGGEDRFPERTQLRAYGLNGTTENAIARRTLNYELYLRYVKRAARKVNSSAKRTQGIATLNKMGLDEVVLWVRYLGEEKGYTEARAEKATKAAHAKVATERKAEGGPRRNGKTAASSKADKIRADKKAWVERNMNVAEKAARREKLAAQAAAKKAKQTKANAKVAANGEAMKVAAKVAKA